MCNLCNIASMHIYFKKNLDDRLFFAKKISIDWYFSTMARLRGAAQLFRLRMTTP